MSAPPPEDPEGPRDPRDRHDLDFDAEFERLIADWGPTPDELAAPDEADGADGADEADAEASETPDEPSTAPAAPAESDSLRNLFRGAWPDEGETEPEDSAEHFVPPPAPPIPRPEPRRAVAWAGLACAPLVGLVLLVLGALPSWASFLLFCWFVGGFAYLVATMNSGGRDGWDDGARI